MLTEELAQITKRLDQVTDQGNEANNFLECLKKAADEVGEAWCGSTLGYHSTIYYEGLKSPPPEALFDPEWGFTDPIFRNQTCGNWIEFDPNEIQTNIYARAGDSSMEKMSMVRSFGSDAVNEFNDCKMQMLSILQIAVDEQNDDFLTKLKNRVDELSVVSEVEVQKQIGPSGAFMTRDSTAASQGPKLPPHLRVLSEALAIRHTCGVITNLIRISKQAESHVARRETHRKITRMNGTRVFIGHGHSPIWRELKEFIAERLNLQVDEFNRMPVAGLTNIDRLSQMLDAASIAFLIMTGEDEQPDGKLQARMNVVHEAGLFQGRLGFHRAIIVLEKGCEEFSNVSGLGQIRFAKDNIKEAFEEIRHILEREGLLRAIS